MDRRVEHDKNYAGLSVLVARHGHVVFTDSVGFAEVETKKPLTNESILAFYSNTKPVTVVALLMLYEELASFQLDDPVSKFIPAFKNMRVWQSGEGDEMVTVPSKVSITLTHLLTHTAGLAYGGDSGPVERLYVAKGVNFSRGGLPLEAACNHLAELPLSFEPGTAWKYSLGIDVIGRVIEVLSGMPFDDFLQRRIFAPLSMHDTGFSLPPEKADRMAAMYTKSGSSFTLKASTAEQVAAFAPDKIRCFSGGGGLLSTVNDYYRFAEMLRRKGELDGTRLLGRKTVEYMTLNHLTGGATLAALGEPSWLESFTATGTGHGLGVAVVMSAAENGVVSSAGEFFWGGMASTVFFVDPAEDLVVVQAAQLTPSTAHPIRRELRIVTHQAIVDNGPCG